MIKKIMVLLYLIICTASLCSCGVTKSDIKNADKFANNFFDKYKNGKITGKNIGEYIIDSKSTQALHSLLVENEDLFTAETIRKEWGIESDIISDKKIESIAKNANEKKLDKVAFKIKSSEKGGTFRKKVIIKAEIKIPVVSEKITEEKAVELLCKEAGVGSFDELKNKFLSERNLTEDELAEYEQEQFETEFLEYILNNYIQKIIIGSIDKSELEKKNITFTVEQRGGIYVITSADVK